MTSPEESCDLCGLPLRFGDFTSDVSGRTYRFCCNGCRHVFHMLLESSEETDPERFKETELFRKCRDMGIIPGSEDELAGRSSVSRPVTVPEPELEAADTDRDALSLSLKVGGMWCPACAWVIEEALKKHSGMIRSACNFSTDRVLCTYDPVLTSPNRIADAVNQLGYEASIPGEDIESTVRRKEFIRFSISAFLTMNVMMLSFALYFGFFSELDPEAVDHISWPIFIMASVVVFYGGWQIGRKALAGFTSAAFGMETLIAVGAFSAYLYSTFNFFSGSIHLYFDTASMLITLVLLGKLLERRAKGRIQQSMEDFFSLQPTKARICSMEHPRGRFVSAAHLRIGDMLRIEAEEVIAADGRVIEGTARVDESMITGEPMPVEKKAGDPVKSGTKVIRGGFKIRAESVGDDATLGQMIQIMEKALGSRTPFEGKTDRMLHGFVPTILLLAFGTGIFCLLSGRPVEDSIIRAVTVMVISCPCALGVAIPLARVAGISVAGRKGILVRDFFSFEQSGKVTAFVFDKTGTLTKGDWRLLSINILGDHDPDDILSVAASMETVSDHYIAMEIKRTAEEGGTQPVPVGDVHIHENGLSGTTGHVSVKIGSNQFLSEEIRASNDWRKHRKEGENDGRSFVYMSMGGRLCAVFIFGDRLKEDAVDTVRQLDSMGYRLSIVSGDGVAATGYVGRHVGIADAAGGMLPQDKTAHVEDLQRSGYTVAMVGDGLNDAPALAQSDLAIAVYSGGHLGKEAANITLMRGEPVQILDFLALARQVNRKIGQNLVCSLMYNVISIPIAMSGLLTPLVAVTAMLMSSLTVIGNTLLLIKKN